MREVPPVNLQAKQGASRWGSHLELQHNGSTSNSRTCMTPPTRAQEHPGRSRIAPMRGRVVLAWGVSLLTTDIINQRGFCVETRPISLQLPFTRCSQMQLPLALQAKLQRLEPLLKAATKSNSLTRENLKDKEPRGTYPASSCTHLLQDSCFPCMERRGKS